MISRGAAYLVDQNIFQSPIFTSCEGLAILAYIPAIIEQCTNVDTFSSKSKCWKINHSELFAGA